MTAASSVGPSSRAQHPGHPGDPERPEPGGRRRLSVVHVITTLTAGGAERQLEMLTARSRSRSSVISLYQDGGLADAIRSRGTEVVEMRARGWRKLVLPLLLALRLRRARPDVVHVHLLSGQLMGIPAARLAGVPLVVSTEHSLMDETIEGRPHAGWLRLLYRGLERWSDGTVAVSEATSGRLQRWGVDQERITVADLGVDLEAVAFDAAGRDGLRRELGVAADVDVIGVVGRLDPVKRVDLALRASAPSLRDGAVMVVAGAGPLLAELTALATELGVSDQVRWLGSRGRMGPVLSSMDVLLSASADETFGMAVVEALGSGLPVVYAQCPALEELSETVDRADHVPSTGDDTRDAQLLGRAVAERLAARSASASGDRGTVAPCLLDAFGAQAAADRVDAVHERLWASRRTRRA